MNVSRHILVLDTSIFTHFHDKYFRTEGVHVINSVVERKNLTICLHKFSYMFCLEHFTCAFNCRDGVVYVYVYGVCLWARARATSSSMCLRDGGIFCCLISRYILGYLAMNDDCFNNKML